MQPVVLQNTAMCNKNKNKANKTRWWLYKEYFKYAAGSKDKHCDVQQNLRTRIKPVRQDVAVQGTFQICSWLKRRILRCVTKSLRNENKASKTSWWL